MNNTKILNSLVFFKQNDRTYFGMPMGGQYIEYWLVSNSNEAAYGVSGQATLYVSGEVMQENYDDIIIEQKKLVAECIRRCAQEKGTISFHSNLYKASMSFSREDDIYDILRKLEQMAAEYGSGKIY